MRVLVIGKGGREHALCWRLNQSPTVREIFCVPGNPGINKHADPVPLDPGNFEALISFAKNERIDLTVVGPEDPLAAGIVDEFTRAGLPIFGPTRGAAQLETSKSFAKEIMVSAKVPTPTSRSFDDAPEARSYIRQRRSVPLVVKADGLALGKGVFVCDDANAALDAVDAAMERRIFGAAGNRVLIEDRLYGEELSFFALCDGVHAVPLATAQDHKQIFEGDRGPNTGGMGAYSPVPHFSSSLESRVMDEIVSPTLDAMSSRGLPFRGVLFVGLIVEPGEKLNVLEFNVRFGDPECEALMMRFEGDLAEALLACASGNLTAAHVTLSSRSAVSVVLASGGYPGEYRRGVPIEGLNRIEGGEPSEATVRWSSRQTRIKVFHAGTALKDGLPVTDGGRVLVVTTMAPRLRDAVETAYEAADMIQFEGKQMRRDIGKKALDREDPGTR